jgi:hypothetical protein
MFLEKRQVVQRARGVLAVPLSSKSWRGDAQSQSRRAQSPSAKEPELYRRLERAVFAESTPWVGSEPACRSARRHPRGSSVPYVPNGIAPSAAAASPAPAAVPPGSMLSNDGGRSITSGALPFHGSTED